MKTLKGLFIKNFKPNNIKVSSHTVNEKTRLPTQTLPSEPVPKVVSMPRDNWIKIAQLNVHSYLAKHEAIITDEAMNHANIMCFIETFLQPQQQLQHFLPIQDECVVFRCDCVQVNSDSLQRGGGGDNDSMS